MRRNETIRVVGRDKERNEKEDKGNKQRSSRRKSTAIRLKRWTKSRWERGNERTQTRIQARREKKRGRDEETHTKQRKPENGKYKPLKGGDRRDQRRNSGRPESKSGRKAASVQAARRVRGEAADREGGGVGGRACCKCGGRTLGAVEDGAVGARVVARQPRRRRPAVVHRRRRLDVEAVGHVAAGRVVAVHHADGRACPPPPPSPRPCPPPHTPPRDPRPSQASKPAAWPGAAAAAAATSETRRGAR